MGVKENPSIWYNTDSILRVSIYRNPAVLDFEAYRVQQDLELP